MSLQSSIVVIFNINEYNGYGGGEEKEKHVLAWIKHDTYNEVRNRLGKIGVNKFVKAMKKGFVRAKGENGIKALEGNSSKIPKKYTHEIKIEGSLENDRIFGYFDKSSKHYIFDLFDKGSLHKSKN